MGKSMKRKIFISIILLSISLLAFASNATTVGVGSNETQNPFQMQNNSTITVADGGREGPLIQDAKQSPQNNSTIPINTTWPVVTAHYFIPSDGKKEDAFNVAVIGDSVAWGNGLIPRHKYSYLVAQWLHETLNRPISVDVYAHSGASIDGGTCPPTQYADLNSGCPTLMDQANSIQNPDKVDLILVSGGINDVGAFNLINPFISSNEITQKSLDIKMPMKNLLTNLLSKNNKSHIIVTNYYPIISGKTQNNFISVIASMFGVGGDLTLDVMKNKLTSNSNTFVQYSTISLHNAVMQGIMEQIA